MTRVLLVANHNNTIYNFRRELLSRLLKDGHHVMVALPAHERNDYFREMGCEVLELPLSRYGTNPIRELGAVFSVASLMRKARPEVVLTYTVKPNIYGGLAAQALRLPYITTVTGLGAVFQRKTALRALNSWLQKIAFRRAEAVFFQNAHDRDEFKRRGVVRERAQLVPGSGVNLDLHGFVQRPERPGRTRFITVSRVRKDKGFNELLSTIRQACESREDVEFHLVGRLDDESYLPDLVDLQDRYPVVVHGVVEQERVHELLASADCLVHASHHEGMANVLLEAAAAGLPCIAPDIPGCREAVEDGVTGTLFPVRDRGALMSAVEAFLGTSFQQRTAMGAAARVKMETQFDREIVIDRYIDEIHRATARPNAEVGA